VEETGQQPGLGTELQFGKLLAGNRHSCIAFVRQSVTRKNIDIDPQDQDSSGSFWAWRVGYHSRRPACCG
jgi:hypothetical protein